ncbi:Uncharacterized protein ToN1_37240 [Aromatoleum petrolei]|nr:Uncharacterized protein ToN1_37240 [Aromatoleum petrolei]
MSALNYHQGPGSPPGLSTEDRRLPSADPDISPKRRINDSWFNRIRWPMFLVGWVAMGLVAFAYLFGAT